jgi:hypothetical protein
MVSWEAALQQAVKMNRRGQEDKHSVLLKLIAKTNDGERGWESDVWAIFVHIIQTSTALGPIHICRRP